MWAEFSKIVEKHAPGTKIEKIERFAFYERAKKTYATLATTERALYACVIIKKGYLL